MDADQAARDRRPDAVVWIDDRRAILAQRDQAGGISTIEIRRLQQTEGRFLGQVVHALGAHEHVMVVGPQPIKLALERRFVAVGHRPDRLMAPPFPAGPDGAAVVAGLERLAA